MVDAVGGKCDLLRLSQNCGLKLALWAATMTERGNYSSLGVEGRVFSSSTIDSRVVWSAPAYPNLPSGDAMDAL